MVRLAVRRLLDNSTKKSLLIPAILLNVKDELQREGKLLRLAALPPPAKCPAAPMD